MTEIIIMIDINNNIIINDNINNTENSNNNLYINAFIS